MGACGVRCNLATAAALCAALACGGKSADSVNIAQAGARATPNGTASGGADQSTGDPSATGGGTTSAGSRSASSGASQSEDEQGGTSQAGDAQADDARGGTSPGGTAPGGTAQAGDDQCIPVTGTPSAGAGANCQGGGAGMVDLPETLGQPCQNALDCTYRAACDVNQGVCVLPCKFYVTPPNVPTKPCASGQVCVAEANYWPSTCYDTCTPGSCPSGFVCTTVAALPGPGCFHLGTAALGESCTPSMISTGCSDPNATCRAATETTSTCQL